MRGLTVDRAGVCLALALGGAKGLWPAHWGERPDVEMVEGAEMRSALLAWAMATMRLLSVETDEEGEG